MNVKIKCTCTGKPEEHEYVVSDVDGSDGYICSNCLDFKSYYK